MNRSRTFFVAIHLLMLWPPTANAAASRPDLVLEDVYEVALGLPHVYFVLREAPGGTPLAGEGEVPYNPALLDTGASTHSISSRTARRLGISIEPQAKFMGVGVGGEEEFGVSEPLILGLAGIEVENPADLSHYHSLQSARCKIRRFHISLSSGPRDSIGMPAMANRVVILDTRHPHPTGYVSADIRLADGPNLPQCPFSFEFRMQSFGGGQGERDIPPLPTWSDNPVIDKVTVRRGARASTATWLLDTGGKISLISTRQAQRLGLLDADGKQGIKPITTLPISGVGAMIMMPIYRIDRLTVPAVSGGRIVYTEVCVGVHDITYPDPITRLPRVIDGVFGSNLLCAARRLPGLSPAGSTSIPFDAVVIDFANKRVGLRPSRP